MLARDIEDAVQWGAQGVARRNQRGRESGQGERARAEVDRRKWCEANARLGDFLERIDGSRVQPNHGQCDFGEQRKVCGIIGYYGPGSRLKELA